MSLTLADFPAALSDLEELLNEFQADDVAIVARDSVTHGRVRRVSALLDRLDELSSERIVVERSPSGKEKDVVYGEAGAGLHWDPRAWSPR